ncbi:MAG TPA: hypothetical protein VN702_17425 [Acetobacteraceae bacterium]|nr:hypothetical protein [Acetobacteraceae bacterium]
MIRTICRTLHIPYRPAYSPDGPVVLYTRAQVAARKALWAKLGAAAVVCTVAATGYAAAQHAPAAWLGIPEPLPAIHAPVPLWRGMPPEPTWRATGEPVHAVPEPASALVLGMAIAALALLRKPAPGGSPVNEENTQ